MRASIERAFPLAATLVAMLLFVAVGCGGETDPSSSAGGSGGVGGTGEGGNGGGGTGGDLPGPVPRIDALDPTTGTYNTEVTVSGANFAPAATSNRIAFGGVDSTVLEAAPDGTWLTTRVPVGAVTGVVTVWSDLGEGLIRVDGPVFEVTTARTPPVVQELRPGMATLGVSTVHTLVGRSFYTDSVVYVGDRPQPTTWRSSTNLTVTFESDAFTGIGPTDLVVRTPGTDDSAAFEIEVVEPVNLISAEALSSTLVELVFDRGVTNWNLQGSVTLSPTLEVEGLQLQADHTLVLVTTAPQSAGVTYRVTVAPDVCALDGGVMKDREAEFVGFAL